MGDFVKVAREYVDEKIPGIDDAIFKDLMNKLQRAEKNTQPMMVDPNFFDTVDLCYNTKIDAETEEERMEQFIKLFMSAPRPLDPIKIKSENQVREYLTTMIESVRKKEVPPVNVIQILHKGKVYSVVSNGRTRAAAAKMANAKIPTKILTIKV